MVQSTGRQRGGATEILVASREDAKPAQFAPCTPSQYSEIFKGGQPFNFAPLGDFQPPSELPTVISGAEMIPADSLAGERKQGNQGGLFGRLFRSTSKRREVLEASIPDQTVEASAASNGQPQKPEKPPPTQNGTSPRLWSLTKTLSGKGLHTTSSAGSGSPPESPDRSLEISLSGGEVAVHPLLPEGASPPAGPPSKRWSLWGRSESRRSASFDAREEAAQPGNGGRGRAQLVSQPSVPIRLPSQNLDDSEQKVEQKQRHKRSKSIGQTPETCNVPLARAQSVDAGAEELRPGVFSFLSCAAPPKVAGEDKAPSPPVRVKAEPNAPLLNLGNLCFHTAVMQCLVNTNDLPKTLWQSFPAVPQPPRYPQHEPLSEFVVQTAPKGAPSSAPANSAESGAVQAIGQATNAVESANGAQSSEEARPIASTAAAEGKVQTGGAHSPQNSVQSVSTPSPRTSEDGSAAGSVVINEDDGASEPSRLSISSRSSSDVEEQMLHSSNLTDVAREQGAPDQGTVSPSNGTLSNLPAVTAPRFSAEEVEDCKLLEASSSQIMPPKLAQAPAENENSSSPRAAVCNGQKVDGEAKQEKAGSKVGPPGEGETPPANSSQNLLEAQKDVRVAEMSHRAAAAAEGEAQPIIARRLSQAMAFVMSESIVNVADQLLLEGVSMSSIRLRNFACLATVLLIKLSLNLMVDAKTPVNPLPAVYYLAQYSAHVTSLMNGMQQDVHELWTTLHEILNDPANGYPEAGGRMADIFEGTTKTTRTCKRCSDVTTGNTEAFTDLILPLTQMHNLSVEACLNAYCAPSTITVGCAKCKAEDEGPQKGLGKKLKKSMFKGKDDGKMCKIGFDSLPPVLAIQLHRCVADSNSLVKLETAVKANLSLQLWKHVCESAKLPKTASKTDVPETAKAKSGMSRPPQPPQPKQAEDGNLDAPKEPFVDGKKASASGIGGLREEDCEYRLYACIFHKGQSQNRGHYYAMCRSGPSDEDWYLYDDHNKPLPLASRGRMDKYLNLTECEKKEICMLFYERQNKVSTPKAKK